MSNIDTARLRRKKRVRGRVSGTAERPRLSVFRSGKHIYIQAIDDVAGATLATASTLSEGFEAGGLKKAEQATKVGTLLAKTLLEKGISKAVFDRNGYRYHGRVKALADGARSGGLQF